MGVVMWNWSDQKIGPRVGGSQTEGLPGGPRAEVKTEGRPCDFSVVYKAEFGARSYQKSSSR